MCNRSRIDENDKYQNWICITFAGMRKISTGLVLIFFKVIVDTLYYTILYIFFYVQIIFIN